MERLKEGDSMIFGKIDYINLLPFHVFLKRSSLQHAFKASCERQKSYPSAINQKFKKRRVDAAFISSIESNKKGITPLNLGIVAQKEVHSVLVKQGSPKTDPASATSNMLSQVLNVQGEVVIGDRALKLYIENPLAYTDLGLLWHERYGLPFVFARLCVNRHYTFYKNLATHFEQKPIKIPSYILNRYAMQRGISPQDIKRYLSLISYTIGKKETKGLKLFLKKARHLKNASIRS